MENPWVVQQRTVRWRNVRAVHEVYTHTSKSPEPGLPLQCVRERRWRTVLELSALPD
jgi:hypothetical protein